MTGAGALRLSRVEDAFAGLVFVVMAGLPLAEFVTRWFVPTGIPGSLDLVKHLTLWVGFLGAAIAAREGKLLAMATGTLIPEGTFKRIATVLSGMVTAAVAGLLVWGGIELVMTTRDQGGTIGRDIPAWIAQLVLPIGLAIIAARIVRLASPHWTGRVIAALGFIVPVVFWRNPELLFDATVWPWAVVLVIAATVGAPIFVLLGGLGALYFFTEAQTPYLILSGAYSLATSGYGSRRT